MAISAVKRFCTLDSGIFAFHLKYLCVSGLWPEDHYSENQRSFYKIYEIAFHILTIAFLTVTTIGLYITRDDLYVMLAALGKIIISYNFFFKTCLFLFKRDDLKKLIKEIEKSGDQVPEATKKFMARGIFVLTLISLVVVSTFTITALLNKEIVIDAWMPFNPYKDYMNLLLSSQILSTLYLPGLCRGFAMQGLVCSLIMYICVQLTDLQKIIRELNYTKQTEIETRHKLKAVIKKHVRLMRYANKMEKLFNEYFLIQNLSVTLEICLNALMIATVSDVKLIVSFLAFLAIVLIDAYVYSYLGNELITRSEGIALAGYESGWTSWPVDMQKDLLMFIQVAQKPLAISAGGMSLMCLETFSQALSNGYSIYAVLNDIVE